MTPDVLDLLDRIRTLDAEYIEPGDEQFVDYQHAKTQFYAEIRDRREVLDPDRVRALLIDRDYGGAEAYLTQQLEGNGDSSEYEMG